MHSCSWESAASFDYSPGTEPSRSRYFTKRHTPATPDARSLSTKSIGSRTAPGQNRIRSAAPVPLVRTTPRQSGEEGVPLAGRCEAAQVNPILVKHMHMKPIDDEIKHPLPPRHDVSPDVHGASGQARRPLADRRTSGATPGGSLAARAASASLARPCWARHEQHPATEAASPSRLVFMDRPSGVRSAAERLRATIPIPCPSPGPSFLWRRGAAGSPRGGASSPSCSDSGPPGA